MVLPFYRRRRRGVRRRRECVSKRFDINEMTDAQVQSRYRFRKDTIFYILSLIELNLSYPSRRGKPVTPLLQLLCFLRFAATGGFFKLIGDSVGLSESTVSRSVYRVASAIAELSPGFIKMPQGEDADAAKRQYYRLSRFPNVLGCVDGTQVRIQAPSRNEGDYVNRKGFHSLNVQMICTSDYKICNVVAKWPGSVHDSRIFRESAVCRKFERGDFDGLILGDSGYPCRRFLMTPFHAPDTDQERAFNRSLCRARVTIEQTFGILKRRFACLHSGLRVDPAKSAVIILACCVLHNNAIDRRDQIEEADTDNLNVFADNPPCEAANDGNGYRNFICQTYF